MSLLFNGIVRLLSFQHRLTTTNVDPHRINPQNQTVADDLADEVTQISFTAQICAADCAMKIKHPEPRLVEHFLAETLAGPMSMERIKNPWVTKGGKHYEKSPRIAIRTLYFDNYIIDSVMVLSTTHQQHQHNIQLVLLGSGMDTRSYRLPILSQVGSIFEVDAKDVTDLKASLLKTVVPEPETIGPEATVVTANLVEDDWPSALMDSGFDRDSPTIWIVEGGTYYLEYVHVLRLIKQIAALSITGSKIGLSAISRVVQNSVKEPIIIDIFKSAMPDPHGLLESAGFHVDHVDIFGGPRANFGRCSEKEIRQADEWKEEREEIYITAIKS